MHAQHPDGESIVLIKRTLSHQGGGDGQLMATGQLGQRLMNARGNGTTTHVKQRALSSLDQIQGRFQGEGIGLNRATEACRNHRTGLHRDVIELLLAHILGDIDQHRAWTPRGSNEEGLCNDGSQIGRVTHHPGVLHDRQGDAEDIGFLESISANRRAGHLTGDHHHGHRVHLGGGDAGHQIGGTGARRTKTDPNLSSGTGVGIRSMGTGLLMAHQDVANPALLLSNMQRVVDRQDRAAGIAKNRVNAMAAQRIHQCFSTSNPLLTVLNGRTGDRWCGSQGHSVVTHSRSSD